MRKEREREKEREEGRDRFTAYDEKMWRMQQSARETSRFDTAASGRLHDGVIFLFTVCEYVDTVQMNL